MANDRTETKFRVKIGTGQTAREEHKVEMAREDRLIQVVWRSLQRSRDCGKKGRLRSENRGTDFPRDLLGRYW